MKVITPKIGNGLIWLETPLPFNGLTLLHSEWQTSFEHSERTRVKYTGTDLNPSASKTRNAQWFGIPFLF